MCAVTDVNASRSTAPEPPRTSDTDHGALGSPLGTAASRPTGDGERATAFHISAWALARSTLVVVLVLASLYLLWRIQEVLLLMLLAIIFAVVYLVALVTTYLPARRSARVYPAEALRYQ